MRVACCSHRCVMLLALGLRCCLVHRLQREQRASRMRKQPMPVPLLPEAFAPWQRCHDLAFGCLIVMSHGLTLRGDAQATVWGA